ASRPNQSRRLLRRARLSPDEFRARAGAAVGAPRGSRQETRRDLSWLWPTISAFHRAGLQRWAELGSVSADHLRRSGAVAGARSEIHVWSCESGAGSRRLSGSGRTRTSRFARAPWKRLEGGLGDASECDTESAVG